MQTHELLDHPACPPAYVRSVTCKVLKAAPYWFRLRWRVEGAQHLILPDFAGRARADDLWRTTCFELRFNQCDYVTCLQ